MTNEDIIKSQAFKVLNKMIDDAVLCIKCAEESIKFRANLVPQYPERCYTRTGAENEQWEELKYTGSEIDSIRYHIKEIDFYKRHLDELKSFKFKLLNEYDFTRGDDSLQKEIFGETV